MCKLCDDAMHQRIVATLEYDKLNNTGLYQSLAAVEVQEESLDFSTTLSLGLTPTNY